MRRKHSFAPGFTLLENRAACSLLNGAALPSRFTKQLSLRWIERTVTRSNTSKSPAREIPSMFMDGAVSLAPDVGHRSSRLCSAGAALIFVLETSREGDPDEFQGARSCRSGGSPRTAGANRDFRSWDGTDRADQSDREGQRSGAFSREERRRPAPHLHRSRRH